MQHSNARGWCEVTIDVVVRKLQGSQHRLTVIPTDLAPFEGKNSLLSLKGRTGKALSMR